MNDYSSQPPKAFVRTFTKDIGFQLLKKEKGSVEGMLSIEPRHKQLQGFVHGGVIATLADVAAGLAAYTLVPENAAPMTAEIKISYLNPASDGRLHIKGMVLKSGRKLIFCEAEIKNIREDGTETTVAKASATMAVVTAGDLGREKI